MTIIVYYYTILIRKQYEAPGDVWDRSGAFASRQQRHNRGQFLTRCADPNWERLLAVAVLEWRQQKASKGSVFSVCCRNDQ